MGYRPNLFARSLRSQRSHTVGIMVFDMTDPYCTLVLRGMENSLYQSSFLPILTDVHNERSRFERYLEMLLDRRIEGLVVLANWLFLDINVLADLEKSKIPTAIVGCELKNDHISSLIVDNALGRPRRVSNISFRLDIARSPSSAGRASCRIPNRAGEACAPSLANMNCRIDPKLIVDLPESRDPFSSFEDGFKLTRGFTCTAAVRSPRSWPSTT